MLRLLSILCSEEGPRPSLVNDVTLLRVTCSTVPVPVLYEPCIVIVAQGRKRFHLPDEVIEYDAQNYFMVTVPVPADCETVVDDDGPFYGIAIRIDLKLVSELLMTIETEALHTQRIRRDAPVSAPRMTSEVSEVSLRLIKALSSPKDAKVLGQHLVREFLYRVLCDEGGDVLRELLLGNENRAQIHRVLNRLNLDYASPLDLTALAHEAGMSSSALHFHFRAVTSTSPVQYLKTLRLHKARMFMVQTSANAATAAERVGYGSTSQFSREFKRQFGLPPAAEAQRIRAAFGFTDEVTAA